MLDALGGGAAFRQTQLKVILDRREQIPESIRRSVKEALQQRLLVGLEAAGHAVLVDAAAAVGQTALTHVLTGARSIHITATVHQQVLSLTHITEFVSEEVLPLDGVPALADLSAAVSQVKLHSPGDGLIRVPGLQQAAVPHTALLLFQCAAQEVNQGEAEHDPQNPSPPHELAQHHEAGSVWIKLQDQIRNPL